MDARGKDGTQVELEVTARCELRAGQQTVRVYARGGSGEMYDLTLYVDDDSLAGAAEMFEAWVEGAEAATVVTLYADVRGRGYVKGAPNTWDEPGYPDHYEEVCAIAVDRNGKTLDIWDCIPEGTQQDIEQGLCDDLGLGE